MEMDVMHSIQQVNEIHLAIHLVTLTDRQTDETDRLASAECVFVASPGTFEANF